MSDKNSGMDFGYLNEREDGELLWLSEDGKEQCKLTRSAFDTLEAGFAEFRATLAELWYENDTLRVDLAKLQSAASVVLAHARKVIKDEAALHKGIGLPPEKAALPDSTIRLALDIIRVLGGEVKP